MATATSPLRRTLDSFRKQASSKQNGGLLIDTHLAGHDDGSMESCGSCFRKSFAVDLLFNLDDVRADCAAGLTTHGNLVTLLKSRINLERTYAHELKKMAKNSRLEELEHGTMKTALGSLKAQYLNTSVQHQQLATSLEEDVLKPIEMLYACNNQRAQNLTRHVNNIKKEAKTQEDAYKRDYNAFEKNFRDASAAFSAAMDSGVSSTLVEDEYHWRLAQMACEEDIAMTKQDANSAGAVQRDPPSNLVAMKTINTSSHKLVNWLLSDNRKEDMTGNTVKLIEAAERCRRKCQQSWQAVEANRIEMYRDVQDVLADYQLIAENRISTIATNLRKHVIFAASALANEQYDWQAIASKFESVDLSDDIRDFILRSQRTRADVPHLAHMTVNDLCNTPTYSKPCRPLRKTCLEIRDISSKKVPFDFDGNQELLCEALGSSRSFERMQQTQKGIQDQGDADSSTTGTLNEDSSASQQFIHVLQESHGDDEQASLEPEDEHPKTHHGEPEHDSDEPSPSVDSSGTGTPVVPYAVGDNSAQI